MTAMDEIWILIGDFIGVVYDICGARIRFFIRRKGVDGLVLSFTVIQISADTVCPARLEFVIAG